MNPKVAEILRWLPVKLTVVQSASVWELTERGPEMRAHLFEHATHAMAAKIADKMRWESEWQDRDVQTFRGECYCLSHEEMRRLLELTFAAGVTYSNKASFVQPMKHQEGGA